MSIQYPSSAHDTSPVLKLPQNTKGRDWFVGDLHGELSKLLAFLEFSAFDQSKDRLIAVGDLVDRGPKSAGLLRFFSRHREWFFSCMGNHDAMMVDALTNPLQYLRYKTGSVWYGNGGGWIEKVDPVEVKGLVMALECLPLAIEVELANALRVGVVHAEVPLWATWSDLETATLDTGDILDMSDRLGASLLWARRRTRMAYRVVKNPSARSISPAMAGVMTKVLAPVSGIDLLITGHTNCEPRRPQWIENLMWIDTGAGYKNGVLSFVDPTTGECIQVRSRDRCRRIVIPRISLDRWRARAAKAPPDLQRGPDD